MRNTDSFDLLELAKHHLPVKGSMSPSAWLMVPRANRAPHSIAARKTNRVFVERNGMAVPSRK
jgi:hypothetical protein